jgi:hypothetical protein
MSDWEKSSELLKDKYSLLSETIKEPELKTIELPQNFENYFKKHTSQGEDTTPFYMKKNTVKNSLSGLMQSFSNRINDNFSNNMQVSKNLLRGFILNGPERKLFSFYDKNCHSFEKDKKYIYVPLHYQPELTTSPCAGAFVDQLVMIQLLASCLPKGYLIYVKEHPKQKIIGRNQYFYNELLGMSNVRLISRRIDSNALIEHSVAVATCIGTAGWEGLFKGKPVLMLGHDFYQYAPGVFSIRTQKDCKSAIEDVIKKNNLPTNLKLRLFLKALSQVAINGYIDPVYRQETQLSEDVNITNIANGLINYIKTVK